MLKIKLRVLFLIPGLYTPVHDCLLHMQSASFIFGMQVEILNEIVSENLLILATQVFGETKEREDNCNQTAFSSTRSVRWADNCEDHG